MPFIIDGSTGFLIPDGAGISLTDDDKLQLGTGNDLQIYHNSSNNHSYIAESNGSGVLRLLTNRMQLRNAGDTTTFINAQSTKVALLHNGSDRIFTTADGVDVEGVGSNFKSTTYNILNLQTDTDDDGTSDDGIFKITNGSGGTTKAEFRWDESEDTVQIAYGDHGRSIVIDSNDRVGINYSSPATTGAQLTVQGPAGSNAIAVLGYGTSGNSWGLGVNAGSTSADASFRVYDKDGSSPYFYVRGDGLIGIGTDSPDRALHLESSNFAGSTIRLKRTGGGTHNDAGLQFTSAAGANADTGMGGIWFQNSLDGNAYALIRARTDDATGTSGRLDFMTNTALVDNNTAPNMTIKSGGNVGIGVTDPTEKLTLTVGNGGGILQSTYYSGTVTNGQKLGVIGFKGYSQGNTVAGADAKIEGAADGNHSGTSAPARLDFYTKDSSIGPGSAPTRRFRIDEQGAAFVHASKNNWSRFVQADNTSVHYRLYGASSSTTNYNLLRYRRHYWGSGSVHITLFQTYYSTTSQGEYWLAGHGRSDGSYNPNYNLVYRDIYNGPGSGRLSINQPGGAPGNSDAEIVDVSISIPAYVYYIVKVEVSHSSFYPTTSTMPAVNSYALFS